MTPIPINMHRFGEEVKDFLKSHGISITKACCGNGWETLIADKANAIVSRPIILISSTSSSIEEASDKQDGALKEIRRLKDATGTYPLIISQDRWHSQNQMTKERILAHLEVFSQVYARNCEVRRIEKAEAEQFLKQYHSYGDATCRYRYGLFLKRHTGHNANPSVIEESGLVPGTLVAVATFSNARKWKKAEKIIRSYEWTRYASIPGVRVAGGMGKLMNTFIKDVKPDDIMSYADLEWSEGQVYEQLGFDFESIKKPVVFKIGKQWERIPIKTELQQNNVGNGEKYFKNFGSSKYRLKLTDYK